MIVFSTTVGVGYVTNAGQILAIGGPATLILAFASIGLLSCFVMDGICEMVSLWPISNPMAQFVHYFVDAELAVVVSLAYWYFETLRMNPQDSD
jgi:yeast amino acid transporter